MNQLTAHEVNKREKRGSIVATDMITEYTQNHQEGLILIIRKYEPYGLALPGGFLEEDLWGQENAIKEVKEETHLDMVVDTVKFLNVYDNPLRDPRRRIVSLTYFGRGLGTYKGDDDAKEARFYTHAQVKDMIQDEAIWAFKDHPHMIQDYYHKMEEGRL